MKKVASIVLILITAIIIFSTTHVLGAGSNGTVGIGGGSPGGTSSNYFVPVAYATDTYMFELVYSDGREITNHMACVIIGPYAGFAGYSDYPTRRECVRVSTLGSQGNGSSLQNIARYLANGGYASDLNSEIEKNADEYISNFLRNLGVADASGNIIKNLASLFSKKHTAFGAEGGNNPGYRILVQYVQGFYKDSRIYRYAPIKEAHDVLRGNFNSGNMGNCSVKSQVVGNQMNARATLRTTSRDVGIAAGTNITSGFNCAQEKRFADKHNGTGYQIIWFDPGKIAPPDYTIDAMCTNCDSSTSDNTAYLIKDSSNWDAIENSVNVGKETNSNVSSYYSGRVAGHVCREEFRVRFPNAQNKIVVQSGRFFGVNEEQGNTVFPVGTPNFGPITFETTAECKPIQEKAKEGEKPKKAVANRGAVLSHYKQDKNSLGKITLAYTELEKAMKDESGEIYKGEFNLKNKTLQNGITSSSDDHVSFKRVDTYKLNWDVYRYIIRGAGRSLASSGFTSLNAANANAEFKGNHLDLGGPNLPISMKNVGYGDDKLGATIKLSFKLPGSSSINESFESNNSFLQGSSNQDNIYKKFIKAKGELTGSDKEEFKNSACALMFNSTSYYNRNVRQCAESRQENKLGDTSSDSCYSKNASNAGGYVCPVKIWDESDEPGKPGDDCDPKVEICCKPGVKPCIDGSCPTIGNSCPNLCPDGSIPINGECPTICEGSTCNILDLVYRPIDLHFPFPGQLSKGRDTGSNWCGYSIQTKKYNCKGQEKNANQIVQNKILKDADHLYEGTPMYSVNLNANLIKNIQKYNNQNSYDDFTLSCTKGICISDFIRDASLVGDLSGSCAKESSAQTCKTGGASS